MHRGKHAPVRPSESHDVNLGVGFGKLSTQGPCLLHEAEDDVLERGFEQALMGGNDQQVAHQVIVRRHGGFFAAPLGHGTFHENLPESHLDVTSRAVCLVGCEMTVVLLEHSNQLIRSVLRGVACEQRDVAERRIDLAELSFFGLPIVRRMNDDCLTLKGKHEVVLRVFHNNPLLCEGSETKALRLLYY